jgi:hypothetical protein
VVGQLLEVEQKKPAHHRAHPNSVPFTIAMRVIRSACALRVGGQLPRTVWAERSR